MALLALLALSSLAAGALRTAPGRATLLLDLCAIAFLLETAPDVHDQLEWWVVPLRLLSNAAPGAFIAWAEAAFTDAPARWRWVPFSLMLLLAGAAMTSGAALAWHATHAAALLLVVAGTARVLAGRTADLVEPRRRARVVFACAVGVVIVATTLLGMAGGGMLAALAAVLAVALAAGLLRLRPAWPTPPLPPVPPLPTAPVALEPSTMTAEERQLAARLQRAMAEERAYREPGLTVGALAARLGVPEHRLRQLINQRLGHRNITEFLNQHRLAEAQAALADPAQARVPVLTIALDAGWGSIGPFNRTFKAATGQTPTEYRRQALADFGSGQPPRDPASPAAAVGKTGTSA